MNKPEPEQMKADCIDKLNDMITKVESGEVTEVMVFGLSCKSSEGLDIYENIAMTRGYQRTILTHRMKRVYPELIFIESLLKR